MEERSGHGTELGHANLSFASVCRSLRSTDPFSDSVRENPSFRRSQQCVDCSIRSPTSKLLEFEFDFDFVLGANENRAVCREKRGGTSHLDLGKAAMEA